MADRTSKPTASQAIQRIARPSDVKAVAKAFATALEAVAEDQRLLVSMATVQKIQADAKTLREKQQKAAKALREKQQAAKKKAAAKAAAEKAKGSHLKARAGKPPTTAKQATKAPRAGGSKRKAERAPKAMTPVAPTVPANGSLPAEA